MPILYNQERVLSRIFRATSGGTVFTSVSFTATVFDYFNDNAVLNDAIYFGVGNTGSYRWNNLKLYIGTPLAGVLTIIWEYYSPTGWKTLTVTDGSAGFTLSGERVVAFEPPSDWQKAVLSGTEAAYIRARISSRTSITEGGAQSFQIVSNRDRGITVTGYSTGTPCTIQDIYNADVAGGWGICSKNGDTQYRIRTNLFVGDSTSTDNRRLSAAGVSSYFSLLDVSLTIDGVLNNSGGVFKIGELADEIKCTTRKTATLNMTQLDVIIGAFYACSGSYYVYGSLVYRLSSDVPIIEAINSTFYNCSSLSSYQWSKSRFQRCNLLSNGFGTGLMLTYPATIKDVVLNMYYATRIWVGGTTGPIDMEDPKFVDCPYILQVQGSSTTTERIVNYINAETDSWNIYWAIAAMNVSVNRQYSFNLKIIDIDRNPVTGADVVLLDVNGTVVFLVTTDATGATPIRNVTTNTYKYASGLNPGVTSDLTPKNPFTLIVIKYGYVAISMVTTVSSKVNTSFSLSVNPYVLSDKETAGSLSGIAIDGVLKTITVTSPCTMQEIYDRTQWWRCQSNNAIYGDPITPSDSNTFNMAVDWSFIIDGVSVAAEGQRLSASGSGTYAIINDGEFTGTLSDATDTRTFIKITGILPGSLIYISDPASVFLGVVTATTCLIPIMHTVNKPIRLRVSYCSGSVANMFIELIQTLTVSGVMFELSNVADSVYGTNGIDGSTITGVTIDDFNLRVNVNTGSVSWGAIYAYNVYWLNTPEGIIDEGRFIEALDQAHYKFYGFKIKNVSDPSVPLKLTGGFGVDSASGSIEDMIDYSGGTIFCTPDNVVGFAYSTGSGLSVEEHNQVMNTLTVKSDLTDLAKTSDLTGIGSLTPTQNTLLENTATKEDVAPISFMDQVLKNKREIVKNGNSWYLVVYGDDEITPILRKPLSDVSGSDIIDLIPGVLAREGASLV